MDLFDLAAVSIFIVTPLLIIGWFVFSLVRFLKRDRTDMLSYSRKRNSLIISGVFLVIDIAFIVFVIIALNDLNHM